MNEDDRELIRALIQAVGALAAAVQQIPRSITLYDPNYRPPGGWGQSPGGAGGVGSGAAR